MKPSTVVTLLAALAPIDHFNGRTRIGCLRSPEETIEAARLGEFGPDIQAANRKTDRTKRKANRARRARRGW